MPRFLSCRRLLTVAALAVASLAATHAHAQIPGTVTASDSLFEDSVEITWEPIESTTATLRIKRDGTTIGIAAATDTVHVDAGTASGQVHEYCVQIEGAVGDLGCDDGARAIRAPRDMTASDGLYTDRIILRWEDHSEIETGYVISREGMDLHTTAPNRITFTDTTSAVQVGVDYEYCVEAIDAAGSRSGPVCATGRRAALLPPRRVTASDGRYPDAIHVTFFRADTTDTATLGYLITRAEGNSDPDTLDTILFSAEGDTLRFVDTDPSLVDGNVYTYCVTAYGEGDLTSDPFCDTGIKAHLIPPTEVSATEDTFDDRVVVTWTLPEIDGEPADNDGYIIGRRVDNGDFDGPAPAIDTVGVGSTQYADFTAVPGETYRYTVTAYTDEGGRRTAASSVIGRRAAVVPPTALEASDGDFEEYVRLTWQSTSTSVLLFKVYRGDELVATVPEWQFEFEDEAILTDVVHTYEVSAVTFIGGGEALRETLRPAFIAAEQKAARAAARFAADPTAPRPRSPYTDPALLARVEQVIGENIGENAGDTGIIESAKATDTGYRSLHPPTDVRATGETDVEESLVRITWADDSAAEDSFRVYRRLEDNPPENDVYLGSVGRNRVRFTDETGESGVRYLYSVRTLDFRGGEGSESARASDEGQRVLTAPINLQATDDAFEDRVRLTWTDRSFAEDGYRIYRNDEEIGEVAAQDEAFEDLFSETGGAFGESYTYAVRAYDAFTESERATDAGGTVLLPPASFSASTTYPDRVVLAWVDQSDSETGYRVYRNGSPITDLPAGATSYEVTPGETTSYCASTLSGSVESTKSCEQGGPFTPPPPVSSGSVIQLEDLLSPAGEDNYGDDWRVGGAVAIDGDYAVMNTDFHIVDTDPTMGDLNVAWVFKRSGGEWTEQALLQPPDDIIDGFTGYEYGESVAISGPWAFVGAPSYYEPGGDSNQRTGAVFVFRREGATWEYRYRFTGSANSNFGRALSADPKGNWLVVGAPGNETTTGAAYVYRREGGTWASETLLLAAPAEIGDRFGQSVAVDGTDIIVGAKQTAYRFSYSQFGSDEEVFVWQHQGQLAIEPDDFIIQDRFGESVALHDGIAVVGDPGANNPRGFLYVYEKRAGIWGGACSGSGESRVCTPNTVITARGSGLDGPPFIGDALAVRGNYIVASDDGFHSFEDTYYGRAYVFQRGPDGWTQVASLEPSSLPGSDVNNVEFGKGLALSSDALLIGAPGYQRQREVGTNENGTPILELQSLGAVFTQPILATPSAVTASDGTYADRVQVRWEDEATNEQGYRIYREDTDGEYQNVGSVGANVESFNDYDAPAGGLYAYRVEAYSDDLLPAFGSAQTSEEALGWLPPDGVIGGQVAAGGGAGMPGVEVCISPSPNGALLLDGEGGRTERYDAQLPGDAFTVELWVRGTGDAGLFSYATPGEDGTENDNAILVYGTADATSLFLTTTSSVIAPVSVLDGTWHHLSVSWSTDGNVAFYVDGENVKNDSGFEVGRLIPSGGVLMLGQEQDAFGGGFQPEQALDGVIDEVRVWDRVRSPEEIAADYYMPLRGDEDGLVLYWPLDQGVGRAGLDPTVGAQHLALVEGAHWSTTGSPLDVCALTDADGNYTFDRIHYGEGQTFQLIPSLDGRDFSPTVKNVSLSRESPIQNEIIFSDITSLTVAGAIRSTYEGTNGVAVCPVEGIEVLVDGVSSGTTESDGTFSIPVDSDPDMAPIVLTAFADQHTFDPAEHIFVVKADTFDLDFEDTTRFAFDGFAGGSCEKTVGELTLRVFTEDGCFDQTFKVGSTDPLVPGDFSILLPPQEYFVEVVDVKLAVGSVLSPSDVMTFYDGLGARPLDLTAGADTLDFIYRAPLRIAISNRETLPTLSCGLDVPVLESGGNYPLNISLNEVYGEDEFCPVDEGQITLFDEWSAVEGLPNDPVTLEIVNGQATYAAAPVEPYTLEGRVVDGVDRSYQKALTILGETEGRNVTHTEWAVIEGTRARTGTFVTAPSSEKLMFVLHDPPGDNSYSYLEEGTTACRSETLEEEFVITGEGGYEVQAGVEAKGGAGLGVFAIFAAIATAGLEVEAMVGGGDGHEEGFTYCATPAQERYVTSDAPEFVGPPADVFVGAGVNYLFAEGDQLSVNEACEVEIETVLLAGLDPDNTFDTFFTYTRRHITGFLLPQLKELLMLEEGDEEAETRLQNGIDTWTGILEEDSTLQANMEFEENHSFSAGAVIERTATYEREDIYHDGKLFFEEVYLGGANVFVASLGGVKAEKKLRLGIRERFESVDTEQNDTTNTATYGYVLADDDSGDFFTVDVGTAVLMEPEFNLPVYHPGGQAIFDLQAGTSSYPWEPGTQARDVPVINANPLVLDNVPPDEAAVFTLSLGNASESEEDREYVLAPLPASNAGGARLLLNGITSQSQTYFIEYGTAVSVPLEVSRGPDDYDYDSLGVTLYAESDYIIWQNGGIRPRADTVYVSASFSDTTGCSPVAVALPDGPWVYNLATDSLLVEVNGFSTDSTDTGVRPTRIGLAYRPLSGAGRGTAPHATAPSAADLTAPRPALSDPTRRAANDATAVASGLPSSTTTSVLPSSAPPQPGKVGGVGAPAAGRDGWTIADNWGIEQTGGWVEEEHPPTFYAAKWAFPEGTPDGPYEIAGVVECSTNQGGDGGETFSEPVAGQLDTKRPRVLGTPQPADGLLSLGDDLTVTFDEAMEDTSFVTEGAEATVTLRPVLANGSLGTPEPLTVTTNSTTAVIEPVSGWTSYAGLFEAAVDGVTDVLGNPLNAQPTLGDDEAGTRRAWRFTVRQGFAWAADSLAFETAAGEPLAFETDLVNGAAEAATFALSGLPDWLDASPLSGTIPPDGSVAIAFTGTAPVAVGDYAATLTATSETGTADLPLGLTVADPACLPPTWGVNPSAFAFSMSATAEVYLGDETTPTDLDGVRVAAFVGGELRGVSPPTTDEGLAHPLVYLDIHSNVSAGEVLAFRVFDPAACAVVDGYTLTEDTAPVLTFAADRVVGSPSAPAALRPSGGALTITLAGATETSEKGYTWFSTNREGPTDLDTVLDGVGSDVTDVITGDNGMAQYTPGMGWMGSLTEIVPGQAYHIALSDEAALAFSGAPVTASTPIDIDTGWNWIGYHPVAPLTPDEALGSLTAASGDVIKGTAGFAQYTPGIGWMGSLEAMEQGQGYRLRVASPGTIVYPDGPPARPAGRVLASGFGGDALRSGLASDEASAAATPPSLGHRGDACEGIASRYPSSMVVTATVEMDAFPIPPRTLTLIATDARGQCRGQGRLEYVDALRRSLAFLMIHGSMSGEPLQLRAFDPETGKTYDGLRIELADDASAFEPFARPNGDGASLVSRPDAVTNAGMLNAPAFDSARGDGPVQPAAQRGARTPNGTAVRIGPTDRSANPAPSASRFDQAVSTWPDSGTDASSAATDAWEVPAPVASALTFEPDAVLGSPESPVVIRLRSHSGRFDADGSEGEEPAGRASEGDEELAESDALGTDGEPSDDESISDEATDEETADAAEDVANGDAPAEDTDPSRAETPGLFGSAGASAPDAFAFAAAYPNPFGQATTLVYALPEAVPVRLAVYDLLGREVAVLVDAEQPAGRYAVRFDAGGLPGGVYVAVLRAGAFTQTHRMVRAR